MSNEKPDPLAELRSVEVPGWVMVVWIAWALLASPLILLGLARLGVELPWSVIPWLPLTALVFYLTWSRNAVKTLDTPPSD